MVGEQSQNQTELALIEAIVPSDQVADLKAIKMGHFLPAVRVRPQIHSIGKSSVHPPPSKSIAR
jgi:hypothetical protein